MKKKILNLFFGFVFIVGVALLLYPTISHYIHQYRQSQVIEVYRDRVEQIHTYNEYKQQALDYNQFVSSYSSISSVLAAKKEYSGRKYEELLDIGDVGVMGVLKIPAVDVELPIYHGTDQEELQIGVGHYRGSSLPIGGENTHSVLTGHRGLPSSRLLTDIDQLGKGDVFYIQVLNETIAYEVDQIKTVLPEELNDINVVQGEDYCTLVTCTPYGINTHRLLVRGKRIAYVDLKNELNQEVFIFPIALIAVGILLMYMFVILVKNKIGR